MSYTLSLTWHDLCSLSVDADYYEDLEPLDFQEGLTSEAALFQACEHLISELEAASLSSSLPKELKLIEKVLVDSRSFLEYREPSPPRQRRRRHRQRFASSENLTIEEEEDSVQALRSDHHRRRRRHSLDSIPTTHSSPDDDDPSTSVTPVPDFTSPEPCQAALIAGGLVRVLARANFTHPLPLRLRRLQEHVASLSDADWVASAFRLQSNVRGEADGYVDALSPALSTPR